MPRDGPKKKKRPVGRKKKKRGWPGEGGLLYWTPSFLPAPSTQQQKIHSEHVPYQKIEVKRTKGNFLHKYSCASLKKRRINIQKTKERRGKGTHMVFSVFSSTYPLRQLLPFPSSPVSSLCLFGMHHLVFFFFLLLLFVVVPFLEQEIRQRPAGGAQVRGGTGLADIKSTVYTILHSL